MAFNYNINWNRIVKENIASFFHRLFRLNMIHSMLKPFKIIHGEFMQLRLDYILKVAYNGQTNYLQKVLNDTFDNTLRRIYISDYGIVNENYIYKKSELQPPIYLHKRWTVGQAFLLNQYAVEGNRIYKALSNNTGNQPSTHPLVWHYERDVVFFKKRVEYNISGGFVVNIPTGLIYDAQRLAALVDYYRLAGRLYVINIF